MTTPINNRSDKEIIRDFKELTMDFKNRGIIPGSHIMINEVSSAF